MSNDDMQIASHAGSYSVHFLQRVADAVGAISPAGPHHIVIDERVAKLHGAGLQPLLAGARSVISLPATEAVKSLEEISDLVARLAQANIRRDHVLIAVGGGIIQDLCCFMASVLFRGIEWMFLPTTLLAQADSCIGSKSSINAAGIKNLVGNFFPPRKIVVAGEFLDTLSSQDVRSGVGEMLKVHIIDGPASFDRLAVDFDLLFSDQLTMQRAIRASLEIKKRIIEVDEFDRGPRMVMNYGHSFGHAIETATSYSVPHGIAVSIGADMANYVAVQMGHMPADHFNRMHPTLRKNYREFEAATIPFDRLLGALGRDKKNVGKDLVLILPDRDARVERVVVPVSENFPKSCEKFLTDVRGVGAIAA